MDELSILKSVTFVNARTLQLEKLWEIKPGFMADIIAIEDDPQKNIDEFKKVTFVMKDGIIYKQE